MKLTFQQSNPLEISSDAKPSVPVFNCVVYVHTDAEARVSGRVANLAGIEASGASEREVLAKVTREFKQIVQTMSENGQAIPWLNPVQPQEEHEQLRSIPVHL